MNSRRKRILEQRAILVERAQAQRLLFGKSAEDLRSPIRFAEDGIHLFKLLTNHPVMVLMGSLGFKRFRILKLLKYIKNGIVIWKIIHSFRTR